MNSHEAAAFTIGILLYYVIGYIVAYIGGHVVDKYHVKVNYTRKINHLVTIGLPFLLQYAFHLEHNLVAVALAAALAPCNLLLYMKPIRDRSPVVAMMFRSFDRPEDRPHTLSWLWTQYFAVFAVYMAIYPVLIASGAVVWMTIPIIVNAVGDGLAEPVGVAFGRHSYSCSALFTRRTYQRTVEGSACVFLSALIPILMSRHTFTDLQFIAALVTIPISAALAEAISPHTWDAPFLFLVIGGELALLSFV